MDYAYLVIQYSELNYKHISGCDFDKILDAMLFNIGILNRIC